MLTNTNIPAISGSVERATFRASIPARGAGSFQTSAQREATADVKRYRFGRKARLIGSH